MKTQPHIFFWCLLHSIHLFWVVHFISYQMHIICLNCRSAHKKISKSAFSIDSNERAKWFYSFIVNWCCNCKSQYNELFALCVSSQTMDALAHIKLAQLLDFCSIVIIISTKRCFQFVVFIRIFYLLDTCQTIHNGSTWCNRDLVHINLVQYWFGAIDLVYIELVQRNIFFGWIRKFFFANVLHFSYQNPGCL